MYDVIYVPLGYSEAVERRRQELIADLVRQGWTMHGIVELMDSLKNVIKVQVLMKA